MNEIELKQVLTLVSKTADILDKLVDKMIGMEARIRALETKIIQITITGMQP